MVGTPQPKLESGGRGSACMLNSPNVQEQQQDRKNLSHVVVVASPDMAIRSATTTSDCSSTAELHALFEKASPQNTTTNSPDCHLLFEDFVLKQLEEELICGFSDELPDLLSPPLSACPSDSDYESCFPTSSLASPSSSYSSPNSPQFTVPGELFLAKDTSLVGLTELFPDLS